MRAIVVVAVAVATLIGLGWYFANSQFNKPAPAALTQTLAPAQQHPPVASRMNVDQNALQKQNEKVQFDSGASTHAKRAAKRSDSDFQMPTDENEVVGKYVHRQMVYPKGQSAQKYVPMDDDLLVMEGRSEDRLSATR